LDAGLPEGLSPENTAAGDYALSSADYVESVTVWWWGELTPGQQELVSTAFPSLVQNLPGISVPVQNSSDIGVSASDRRRWGIRSAYQVLIGADTDLTVHALERVPGPVLALAWESLNPLQREILVLRFVERQSAGAVAGRLRRPRREIEATEDAAVHELARLLRMNNEDVAVEDEARIWEYSRNHRDELAAAIEAMPGAAGHKKIAHLWFSGRHSIAGTAVEMGVSVADLESIRLNAVRRVAGHLESMGAWVGADMVLPMAGRELSAIIAAQQEALRWLDSVLDDQMWVGGRFDDKLRVLDAARRRDPQHYGFVLDYLAAGQRELLDQSPETELSVEAAVESSGLTARVVRMRLTSAFAGFSRLPNLRGAQSRARTAALRRLVARVGRETFQECLTRLPESRRPPVWMAVAPTDGVDRDRPTRQSYRFQRDGVEDLVAILRRAAIATLSTREDKRTMVRQRTYTVAGLLDCLPTYQGAVLALRLPGMPVNEVADELGLASHWVRTYENNALTGMLVLIAAADAVRSTESADLVAALDLLPDHERDAFVLVFERKLDPEVAAALMKRSRDEFAVALRHGADRLVATLAGTMVHSAVRRAEAAVRRAVRENSGVSDKWRGVLTAKQRQVASARYGNDDLIAEIAEACEISERAVVSRLRGACDALCRPPAAGDAAGTSDHEDLAAAMKLLPSEAAAAAMGQSLDEFGVKSSVGGERPVSSLVAGPVVHIPIPGAEAVVRWAVRENSGVPDGWRGVLTARQWEEVSEHFADNVSLPEMATVRGVSERVLSDRLRSACAVLVSFIAAEKAVREADSAELAAAVDLLPARERDAFVLVFERRMDPEAAAALMGRSRDEFAVTLGESAGHVVETLAGSAVHNSVRRAEAVVRRVARESPGAVDGWRGVLTAKLWDVVSARFGDNALIAEIAETTGISERRSIDRLRSACAVLVSFIAAEKAVRETDPAELAAAVDLLPARERDAFVLVFERKLDPEAAAASMGRSGDEFAETLGESAGHLVATLAGTAVHSPVRRAEAMVRRAARENPRVVDGWRGLLTTKQWEVVSARFGDHALLAEITAAGDLSEGRLFDRLRNACAVLAKLIAADEAVCEADPAELAAAVDLLPARERDAFVLVFERKLEPGVAAALIGRSRDEFVEMLGEGAGYVVGTLAGTVVHTAVRRVEAMVRRAVRGNPRVVDGWRGVLTAKQWEVVSARFREGALIAEIAVAQQIAEDALINRLHRACRTLVESAALPDLPGDTPAAESLRAGEDEPSGASWHDGSVPSAVTPDLGDAHRPDACVPAAFEEAGRQGVVLAGVVDDDSGLPGYTQQQVEAGLGGELREYPGEQGEPGTRRGFARLLEVGEIAFLVDEYATTRSGLGAHAYLMKRVGEDDVLVYDTVERRWLGLAEFEQREREQNRPVDVVRTVGKVLCARRDEAEVSGRRVDLGSRRIGVTGRAATGDTGDDDSAGDLPNPPGYGGPLPPRFLPWDGAAAELEAHGVLRQLDELLPSGVSPEKVAAGDYALDIVDDIVAVIVPWWNGLTSREQDAVAQAVPLVVGNLPGVPITVRHNANFAAMQDEYRRLKRRSSDPSVSAIEQIRAGLRMAELMLMILSIRGAQHDFANTDRSLMPAALFVLYYVPGETRDQIGVLSGNLGAESLTVYVPSSDSADELKDSLLIARAHDETTLGVALPAGRPFPLSSDLTKATLVHFDRRGEGPFDIRTYSRRAGDALAKQVAALTSVQICTGGSAPNTLLIGRGRKNRVVRRARERLDQAGRRCYSAVAFLDPDAHIRRYASRDETGTLYLASADLDAVRDGSDPYFGALKSSTRMRPPAAVNLARLAAGRPQEVQTADRPGALAAMIGRPAPGARPHGQYLATDGQESAVLDIMSVQHPETGVLIYPNIFMLPIALHFFGVRVGRPMRFDADPELNGVPAVELEEVAGGRLHSFRRIDNLRHLLVNLRDHDPTALVVAAGENRRPVLVRCVENRLMTFDPRTATWVDRPPSAEEIGPGPCYAIVGGYGWMLHPVDHFESEADPRARFGPPVRGWLPTERGAGTVMVPRPVPGVTPTGLPPFGAPRPIEDRAKVLHLLWAKDRAETARAILGPLSDAEAESLAGFTEAEHTALQQLVEVFHESDSAPSIELGICLANPYGVLWRSQGNCHPKTAWLHMKSLDHLDWVLGARLQHLGKVGIYEPSIPDWLTEQDMTPAQWQALRERLAQRRQEWLAWQRTRLHPPADVLIGPDGIFRLKNAAGEFVEVVTDMDGRAVFVADDFPAESGFARPSGADRMESDRFDRRLIDSRVDYEFITLILYRMGIVQHGFNAHWLTGSRDEAEVQRKVLAKHVRMTSFGPGRRPAWEAAPSPDQARPLGDLPIVENPQLTTVEYLRNHSRQVTPGFQQRWDDLWNRLAVQSNSGTSEAPGGVGGATDDDLIAAIRCLPPDLLQVFDLTVGMRLYGFSDAEVARIGIIDPRTGNLYSDAQITSMLAEAMALLSQQLAAVTVGKGRIEAEEVLLEPGGSDLRSRDSNTTADSRDRAEIMEVFAAELEWVVVPLREALDWFVNISAANTFEDFQPSDLRAVYRADPSAVRILAGLLGEDSRTEFLRWVSRPAEFTVDTFPPESDLPISVTSFLAAVLRITSPSALPVPSFQRTVLSRAVKRIGVDAFRVIASGYPDDIRDYLEEIFVPQADMEIGGDDRDIDTTGLLWRDPILHLYLEATGSALPTPAELPVWESVLQSAGDIVEWEDALSELASEDSLAAIYLDGWVGGRTPRELARSCGLDPIQSFELQRWAIGRIHQLLARQYEMYGRESDPWRQSGAAEGSTWSGEAGSRDSDRETDVGSAGNGSGPVGSPLEAAVREGRISAEAAFGFAVSRGLRPPVSFITQGADVGGGDDPDHRPGTTGGSAPDSEGAAVDAGPENMDRDRAVELLGAELAQIVVPVREALEWMQSFLEQNLSDTGADDMGALLRRAYTADPAAVRWVAELMGADQRIAFLQWVQVPADANAGGWHAAAAFLTAVSRHVVSMRMLHCNIRLQVYALSKIAADGGARLLRCIAADYPSDWREVIETTIIAGRTFEEVEAFIPETTHRADSNWSNPVAHLFAEISGAAVPSEQECHIWDHVADSVYSRNIAWRDSLNELYEYDYDAALFLYEWLCLGRLPREIAQDLGIDATRSKQMHCRAMRRMSAMLRSWDPVSQTPESLPPQPWTEEERRLHEKGVPIEISRARLPAAFPAGDYWNVRFVGDDHYYLWQQVTSDHDIRAGVLAVAYYRFDRCLTYGISPLATPYSIPWLGSGVLMEYPIEIHYYRGLGAPESPGSPDSAPVQFFDPEFRHRMVVLDYGLGTRGRAFARILNTYGITPHLAPYPFLNVHSLLVGIEESGRFDERTDFVVSALGEPLLATVVEPLQGAAGRTAEDMDSRFGDILRRTAIFGQASVVTETEIDGVLARFEEIRTHGLVTGEAWPGLTELIPASIVSPTTDDSVAAAVFRTLAANTPAPLEYGFPTGPVSPAELEAYYGIPLEMQRRYQASADWSNLIHGVRPSNRFGTVFMRYGLSRPKPQTVKSKSSTFEDAALGAPLSGIGLQLAYPPSLPDPMPSDPERRRRLEQHHQQRMQDWLKAIARSDLTVDEQHQVRLVGESEPVGNDIDDAELLHAHTFAAVDDPVLYQAALVVGRWLFALPREHGAYGQWDTADGSREDAQRSDIAAQHRPGGIPIIWFIPGMAQAYAVWGPGPAELLRVGEMPSWALRRPRGTGGSPTSTLPTPPIPASADGTDREIPAGSGPDISESGPGPSDALRSDSSDAVYGNPSERDHRPREVSGATSTVGEQPSGAAEPTVLDGTGPGPVALIYGRFDRSPQNSPAAAFGRGTVERSDRVSSDRTEDGVADRATDTEPLPGHPLGHREDCVDRVFDEKDRVTGRASARGNSGAGRRGVPRTQEEFEERAGYELQPVESLEVVAERLGAVPETAFVTLVEKYHSGTVGAHTLLLTNNIQQVVEHGGDVESMPSTDSPRVWIFDPAGDTPVWRPYRPAPVAAQEVPETSLVAYDGAGESVEALGGSLRVELRTKIGRARDSDGEEPAEDSDDDSRWRFDRSAEACDASTEAGARELLGAVLERETVRLSESLEWLRFFLKVIGIQQGDADPNHLRPAYARNPGAVQCVAELMREPFREQFLDWVATPGAELSAESFDPVHAFAATSFLASMLSVSTGEFGPLISWRFQDHVLSRVVAEVGTEAVEVVLEGYPPEMREALLGWLRGEELRVPDDGHASSAQSSYWNHPLHRLFADLSGSALPSPERVGEWSEVIGDGIGRSGTWLNCLEQLAEADREAAEFLDKWLGGNQLPRTLARARGDDRAGSQDLQRRAITRVYELITERQPGNSAWRELPEQPWTDEEEVFHRIDRSAAFRAPSSLPPSDVPSDLHLLFLGADHQPYLWREPPTEPSDDHREANTALPMLYHRLDRMLNYRLASLITVHYNRPLRAWGLVTPIAMDFLNDRDSAAPDETSTWNIDPIDCYRVAVLDYLLGVRSRAHHSTSEGDEDDQSSLFVSGFSKMKRGIWTVDAADENSEFVLSALDRQLPPEVLEPIMNLTEAGLEKLLRTTRIPGRAGATEEQIRISKACLREMQDSGMITGHARSALRALSDPTGAEWTGQVVDAEPESTSGVYEDLPADDAHTELDLARAELEDAFAAKRAAVRWLREFLAANLEHRFVDGPLGFAEDPQGIRDDDPDLRLARDAARDVAAQVWAAHRADPEAFDLAVGHLSEDPLRSLRELVRAESPEQIPRTPEQLEGLLEKGIWPPTGQALLLYNRLAEWTPAVNIFAQEQILRIVAQRAPDAVRRSVAQYPETMRKLIETRVLEPDSAGADLLFMLLTHDGPRAGGGNKLWPVYAAAITRLFAELSGGAPMPPKRFPAWKEVAQAPWMSREKWTAGLRQLAVEDEVAARFLEAWLVRHLLPGEIADRLGIDPADVPRVQREAVSRMHRLLFGGQTDPAGPEWTDAALEVLDRTRPDRYIPRHPTPEELAGLGLPVQEQRRSQHAADTLGVGCYIVLPAGPEGAHVLESGATHAAPAHVAIAPRDLLDYLLGAPWHTLGLIGPYQPRMPEGLHNLTGLDMDAATLNDLVTARYRQRMREWQIYRDRNDVDRDEDYILHGTDEAGRRRPISGRVELAGIYEPGAAGELVTDPERLRTVLVALHREHGLIQRGAWLQADPPVAEPTRRLRVVAFEPGQRPKVVDLTRPPGGWPRVGNLPQPALTRIHTSRVRSSVRLPPYPLTAREQELHDLGVPTTGPHDDRDHSAPESLIPHGQRYYFAGTGTMTEFRSLQMTARPYPGAPALSLAPRNVIRSRIHECFAPDSEAVPASTLWFSEDGWGSLTVFDPPAFELSDDQLADHAAADYVDGVLWDADGHEWSLLPDGVSLEQIGTVRSPRIAQVLGKQLPARTVRRAAEHRDALHQLIDEVRADENESLIETSAIRLAIARCSEIADTGRIAGDAWPGFTDRLMRTRLRDAANRREELRARQIGRSLDIATHRARPLGPLAVYEAEDGYGIPSGVQDAYQAVADELGVQIHLCPVNHAGSYALSQGFGSPKARQVKYKTITFADLLLGAPDWALGKVVVYQPGQVPPRIAGRQRLFLEKLHEQRQADWDDAHARDDLEVGERGEVSVIGPDGSRRLQRADVDIYNICYPDGRTVDDPELVKKCMDRLVELGLATHGDVVHWWPLNEKEQRAKSGQMERYTTLGGERVLAIRPGASPAGVPGLRPDQAVPLLLEFDWHGVPHFGIARPDRRYDIADDHPDWVELRRAVREQVLRRLTEWPADLWLGSDGGASTDIARLVGEVVTRARRDLTRADFDGTQTGWLDRLIADRLIAHRSYLNYRAGLVAVLRSSAGLDVRDPRLRAVAKMSEEQWTTVVADYGSRVDTVLGLRRIAQSGTLPADRVAHYLDSTEHFATDLTYRHATRIVDQVLKVVAGDCDPIDLTVPSDNGRDPADPWGIRFDTALPEETALVARAKAGDAGAFDILWSAVVRSVTQYVWSGPRGEGRPQEVERHVDRVVAEIRDTAEQQIRSLPDDERFSAWLGGVAVRVVRDSTGYRRLRESVADRYRTDAGMAPEDIAALRLHEATDIELRDCVDNFTDKMAVRDVLRLRMFYGLTGKETAVLMEMPESAVEEMERCAATAFVAHLLGTRGDRTVPGEAMTVELPGGVTDELISEVLARSIRHVEYPIGEQLRPEQVAELCHIPADDLRQIQQMVDVRGTGLSIRPPSPHGVRWVRSGMALPKPRFILDRFIKTINEFDLLLGADPQNLGSAAIFEPVMPVRPEKPGRLTDREWDQAWHRLIRRYEHRLREYLEIQLALEHSDDVRVDRTGAIYLRGEDGRWRPVSSDYDIYAVHHPDGTLVSDRPRYDADIDYFCQQPGSRFMNGAAVQLEVGHYEHAWTKDSLLEEHEEGGIPVLLILPGQSPRLVWGLDRDVDDIPSVSPK
jgi:DNA-directed RNA polymerase specialized sigma24 family protein